LPALAAVHRPEQHVATEVQDVRVERREQQGHRPDKAVSPRPHRLGGHVLDLACAPVEARDLAAVHDVGVQRIGGHVAVLLGTDGMPLADSDLAVGAAAQDAGRSALLLAAVYAVGKGVVGADMVELCRGLVVPRAPRLAAVDRDDGALIAREEDDVGIVRIDPEAVVVVAARRAPQRAEGLAAVRGLPRHDVRHVHDIGVLRIDLHLVEIAVATPQALVRVDEPPPLAAVVGAVHSAAVGGAHYRVHAGGLAGRHGEADAAQPVLGGGQAGGDAPPRGPSIDGFVQAVVGGEGPGTADLPRRLARRPEHGEHRLRVRGVECDVHGAGVLVGVQHLLPRCPAVLGAEHATLCVRAVRVTEHRDEDPVRIVRVDDHSGDLLAVPQAELPPRPPGVGGLVDPVAHRQVGALQAFAAADIDNVGIGTGDGESADRAGRLSVEDRSPGAPVVGALPHAAVVDADIEDVRLTRHTGRPDGTAAAKRPNQAPVQAGEEGGVVLLGDGEGREERQDNGPYDRTEGEHAMVLRGEDGKVSRV